MIAAGTEQLTAIPAAVPVAVGTPASPPSFALKEAVVTAPAASLIEHIKQNAPVSVTSPVAMMSQVAPVAVALPSVATAPGISPQAAWEKVIALAPGRTQKALLAKLSIESIASAAVIVAAPHDCLELAQAAEAEIEASLVNILGRRVTVEIRDAGKSAEKQSATSSSLPAPTSMSMVEANPLVKRATELFGVCRGEEIAMEVACHVLSGRVIADAVEPAVQVPILAVVR